MRIDSKSSTSLFIYERIVQESTYSTTTQKHLDSIHSAKGSLLKNFCKALLQFIKKWVFCGIGEVKKTDKPIVSKPKPKEEKPSHLKQTSSSEAPTTIIMGNLPKTSKANTSVTLPKTSSHLVEQSVPQSSEPTIVKLDVGIFPLIYLRCFDKLGITLIESKPPSIWDKYVADCKDNQEMTERWMREVGTLLFIPCAYKKAYTFCLEDASLGKEGQTIIFNEKGTQYHIQLQDKELEVWLLDCKDTLKRIFSDLRKKTETTLTTQTDKEVFQERILDPVINYKKYEVKTLKDAIIEREEELPNIVAPAIDILESINKDRAVILIDKDFSNQKVEIKEGKLRITWTFCEKKPWAKPEERNKENQGLRELDIEYLLKKYPHSEILENQLVQQIELKKTIS